MPIVTADQANIARAGQILREGWLVAFPTETVYGLGCDATNGEAVARCYAAKGRPSFNPLIVHVADVEAAQALGAFNQTAFQLAQEFWPGPLTIVVPRRPDGSVCELATAGLETIALRVPSNPLALALIQAAGRPLAAPSANRSGHVSPTTARHVLDDLGDLVPLILDGGPCQHGLESTVVAVDGETVSLLRPGAVSAESLEAKLRHPLLRAAHDPAMPSSPGQLASHYAPCAPVRLNAISVAGDEALLAFGAELLGHAGPSINLSPRGDLIEAAANLFRALRELDGLRPSCIAVMPIPSHGLGLAINDRLNRAAAARPV